MSKSWKEECNKLFFDTGLSIKEINERLGVSKVSISKHLNSNPDYKHERLRRKEQNSDRKRYYREYKKEYRKEKKANELKNTAFKINYNVDAQDIKKEQRMAAIILSRERFFK